MRFFLLLLVTGLGGLSLTETITETTTDQFQVTGSASSSGLPAFSLYRPVVCKEKRQFRCEWYSAVPKSRPTKLFSGQKCQLKQKYLQLLILAAGYPHWEQVDFWMWYDERPHLRHKVWVLLCLLPNEEVPFVCKKQQKSDFLATFYCAKLDFDRFHGGQHDIKTVQRMWNTWQFSHQLFSHF